MIDSPLVRSVGLLVGLAIMVGSVASWHYWSVNWMCAAIMFCSGVGLSFRAMDG